MNDLDDSQPVQPNEPGADDRAFTRRTLLLSSSGLMLPRLLSNQANKPVTPLQNAPGVRPYLVAQLGHSELLASATFSPDGKFVLTSARDRTARLWEMATGREIRRFEGHTEGLTTAVFSADGRHILTGSEDFTARLWDAATGKQLQLFKGHTNWVMTAVFSPDEKRVLTASEDHTARLWDAASGKELQRFVGHTDRVTRGVFCADNGFVLTASQDGTVRFWSVATGKETRRLSNLGAIADVDASGRRILTLSSGEVRLWEIGAGKETPHPLGHADGIDDVVFSLGGKYVLTSAINNRIGRVWETSTRREVNQFEARWNREDSAVLSADGKHVLTSGLDKTASLWETAAGTEIRRFEGQADCAKSAVLAANGKYILTANTGGNNSASLWETVTGKQVRRFLGHSERVSDAVFSPDGEYVLTAGWDKTARLWDTETGREIRRFNGHTSLVNSAVFSADGKTILTASWDNTVRLWEAQTGKEILRTEAHPSGVETAVFSSDNRYFLSTANPHASQAVSAQLWESSTGREIRQFKGHSNLVGSAVFSSDDACILTASLDGTARLWETATGRELQRFQGHTGSVYTAIFSQDGREVLTAGEDGTARLWEMATGKEVRQFASHSDGITSAAFASRGSMIMAACEDGAIRMWDASTSRELCRFMSFRGGPWAVTDNEGRFDADNGGEIEGLHWVIGNECIDLSQLKARYYDPGLLARILTRDKLPGVQAFGRVPLQPEVSLPKRMPVGGKVTVSVTNRGGGIGRVQILVNGKEVQGDARGLNPKTDAPRFDLPFDIAPYRSLLTPGQENTLGVIAYNGENWLASRAVECIISVPKEKPTGTPRLLAIIGGIDAYSAPELHLRFAAKDAEEFAAALSLGANRLFGADHVEIVRLTGVANPGALAPTKANFAKAFADARKLRAQDILVVYLAGHGAALGKGDLYCYLTQEARAVDSSALADIDLRQKTAITSDELIDWIKRINARKQVMILDTCAAGAFSARLTSQARELNGSQARALDRLKDRTGFAVLMGCAADRVSYEASRYGQGVMTYALLQGMKGAALAEGGQVDVSRLFQYAVDRVPQLSGEIGGIQRPQVCSPGGVSFPVGRMEKADEEKVRISEAHPLILRPSMTDVEAGFDSLNLTSLIRTRLGDLLLPEARGARQPAVVYVDADEMPGAIRPFGTYTVQGDKVMARIVLRQDSKTIQTMNIEGLKSDAEALAAAITGAIAEASNRLSDWRK